MATGQREYDVSTLDRFALKVSEGNKDLPSMSIEQLQEEALYLEQQLARSKAVAKVATLRSQLLRAQRTIESAPRMR